MRVNIFSQVHEREQLAGSKINKEAALDIEFIHSTLRAWVNFVISVVGTILDQRVTLTPMHWALSQQF